MKTRINIVQCETWVGPWCKRSSGEIYAVSDSLIKLKSYVLEGITNVSRMQKFVIYRIRPNRRPNKLCPSMRANINTRPASDDGPRSCHNR